MCTRILYSTDIGAQCTPKVLLCTPYTPHTSTSTPNATFSCALSPSDALVGSRLTGGRLNTGLTSNFTRLALKTNANVKLFFLFETEIFSQPQTCLDHGQTKPILVVLRLPSTPMEQNMSVRPCPGKIDYSWLSHLRVELMMLNNAVYYYSALESKSVNGECEVVIMVCPGKDSRPPPSWHFHYPAADIITL